MTSKPLHLLASGYYGFENLGDELILQVLAQETRKRGIHLTVLSQQPDKTARQYGVQAVHRLNGVAILQALARCDGFLSGGGGLFQDATGPASVLYYGGLVGLARAFGKPVFFWSQGIGPLERRLSQCITGWVLKAAQRITVRDAGSAAWVTRLAGRSAEVTADPVWCLELPPAGPRSDVGPSRIGISLRPWPDLTSARLRALAEKLSALGPNTQWVFLPFQPAWDTPVLQALEAELMSLNVGPCEWATPETLLEALVTCRGGVVGMRFHSLVLALLAGVPVFGLAYDPKVQSLLTDLHLPGATVAGLDALPEMTFRTVHPPDLAALQEKARRNFQLLDGFGG